jgi:antitoxin YefM
VYDNPSISGAATLTLAYSTARAKLADTVDRACDDLEAIIITRSGQQSVAMMSLDDFQAMEERS